MGVGADVDGQCGRFGETVSVSAAMLVPRTCTVTIRSVRDEPPRGRLALLNRVRESDADHARRAVLARLGAHPAQCELACVVDALGEVAAAPGWPSSKTSPAPAAAASPNDIEDARRTDDAERTVAPPREQKVLLTGKISQHRLRCRRGPVDPNGGADHDILDRPGSPVMPAGVSRTPTTACAPSSVRLLREPAERPPARVFQASERVVSSCETPLACQPAHAPGLCCQPTW